MLAASETPLSPSPPSGATSPLGTPATAHAMKIASRGLEAAESLEDDGMLVAAAEVKAAALSEAAEAYSRRRAAHAAFRSPLGVVSSANSKGVLNRGDGKRPYRVQEASSSASVPAPVSEESDDEPTLQQNVADQAGAPPSDVAVVNLRDLATQSPVRSRPSSPIRPEQLHAVVISGASVVRHLEGGDFCLYQLTVPLTHSQAEHVAFKRYRDFLELDSALCRALQEAFNPLVPCFFFRDLPSLPPRTIPWVQDATHHSVVAKRWAALQRYLDVALEKAAQCPEAFVVLKTFLCLP